MRTKTPNRHFSDFSDEQSGETPLDEVAKDAVEVEEEPGQGNWACRQVLWLLDLPVSEELHRDDHESPNYRPDDKGHCCRIFLRLCVRVQDGLVIAIEPPLERLPSVNVNPGRTEDNGSNDLEGCFGEDVLGGWRRHRCGGRDGGGVERLTGTVGLDSVIVTPDPDQHMIVNVVVGFREHSGIKGNTSIPVSKMNLFPPLSLFLLLREHGSIPPFFLAILLHD